MTADVERPCSVEGCDGPLRTPGAAWCAKHYHRWYRHGDPNRTVSTEPSIVLGRYRRISRPGHPLASPSGMAYLHRVLLYDTAGPGPHPCHWCGRLLNWGRRGDPDAIQVDHLNRRRDDNDLTNLVATCQRCNLTRAKQTKTAALRAAGWWSSHHDTVGSTTGRLPRVG